MGNVWRMGFLFTLFIAQTTFANSEIKVITSKESRTFHPAKSDHKSQNLRPYALFVHYQEYGGWVWVNGSTPCSELYEEMETAIGVDELEKNYKEGDYNYFFIMSCDDSLPDSRRMHFSSWVQAQSAVGDKVVRGLYEGKELNVFGKARELVQPLRTMMKLTIAHNPSKDYPMQMILNTPFHKRFEVLDELYQMVDVGDPFLRRKKMLEFLYQNFPEWDHKTVAEMLNRVGGESEEIEFDVSPIFEMPAYGGTWDAWGLSLSLDFDCRKVDVSVCYLGKD